MSQISTVMIPPYYRTSDCNSALPQFAAIWILTWQCRVYSASKWHLGHSYQIRVASSSLIWSSFTSFRLHPGYASTVCSACSWQGHLCRSWKSECQSCCPRKAWWCLPGRGFHGRACLPFVCCRSGAFYTHFCRFYGEFCRLLKFTCADLRPLGWSSCCFGAFYARSDCVIGCSWVLRAVASLQSECATWRLLAHFSELFAAICRLDHL